jgi:hypothetical protein
VRSSTSPPRTLIVLTNARFHILRTSGLVPVTGGAVLREIESELDDLLRLHQILPVVRELRLGIGRIGVDPGLLGLEGRHVDRVGVVGAKELLPLLGELTEPPTQELRRLSLVPLSLGHLRSEHPLLLSPAGTVTLSYRPDVSFEVGGRDVSAPRATRAAGVRPMQRK